jgi:hypothetical protein
VNETAYIVAAWLGTFASVAAYAAWIIRRGRRASEVVDEQDRRWL